jgi:hypothetical protein
MVYEELYKELEKIYIKLNAKIIVVVGAFLSEI